MTLRIRTSRIEQKLLHLLISPARGHSIVHQCESIEYEEAYFPSPLMSNEMKMEDLMMFIQYKAKECFRESRKCDQVEAYFFWQIMELFCQQNGDVMACEIALLLFKGYDLLRNNTVRCRDATKWKEWCIPLAKLLCSAAPDDARREAVIKMGDDLARRNRTFAAHICYVVAKVELGSRSKFELIGTASVPFGTEVMPESIERTETYEYVLSLTSGQAQPSFQVFKLCHASRYAVIDMYEEAFKYCEVISKAVITFPDKITRSFIGRLISLTCKLRDLLEEECEWLLELEELHRTKLAEAQCGHDEVFDIKHSEGCLETVEIPNLQPTDPEHLLDANLRFSSRYKRGKLLGKGGYGSVYRGVRIADKKEVAIKYVLKNKEYKTITIPGETQELPLEVALMKMTSKPPHCSNVLQLLEWFDIDQHIILILERPSPCMDIEDFSNRQNGCLSEAQTREIMVQVVRAARHSCDHGVLHRDIKPENLLINPDTMEVKLIDFGCGELMQDKPYTFYIGTKPYIPPEYSVCGRYMGISATIWGLGILMVKLLCGKYPFNSLQDLKKGRLELCTDLSRECLELIMWCLEVNPESRPTFDDLVRHEWFTGVSSGLNEENQRSEDTL
ncbi:hypothetical protein QTP70_025792 [Hemibagrus guttatus]|uniref:non-specific serine/threonine protein kinase n=1 Tax=Hemibagrus guttatus TaxID=175788 RepID=A0AAE0PUN4_9TELE|nr:hypothetical protein QTP70_025792 [Hemibagrus guttatus]